MAVQTAKGRLPLGKIPVTLLRRLLATPPGSRDRRVVVGPGIGLDAAAIDLGNQYLLAKTDPITLVGDEIGAYALAINANDLATMGAIPRWFLATILFPQGTMASQVTRVFSQLNRACRQLKVSVCGGHTEITNAVTRPVVVGCLLGECPKKRLITTADARVGDALLLTKGIPIEAVSILARERTSELHRRYPASFVGRCRRYLNDPGISVVRDATLALAAGGVHAMHDPTEGGLSSALYELAEAAGVGLRIRKHAIRVLPEGARLCEDYGLDPMGAIASGALLICADPGCEAPILRRLSREGIAVARIGTVVPAREGVRMVTDTRRGEPIPRFAVDEIARLFSGSQRTRRVKARNSRGSRPAGTAS